MAETLVELVAKITADTASLKKALTESEKGVEGLGKQTEKESKSIKDRFLEIGKAATIMGGAILLSMGGAVKSFVATGSELNDLSLKTGVSVKALAGLKYAAEQNGATLGTVEMAIRRTASSMQDVRDGTLEAKRSFERLHLTLDDLKGLNPEQQFLKIASAIAEIPDPMTRAATAQDLFGRSGMDMLPMLSQGADGLHKLMEEGVKLTGWTDKSASSADALGDAFDTLKTATTGVFSAVGLSLAPVLKSVADELTKITKSVIEWTQKNPELTKALTTATIAIGALATGIGLASLAVKYLGTTTNLYFGGILVIIGAVVAGIVLLVEWFGRGEKAARKLAEEQLAEIERVKASNKALYAHQKEAIDKDFADKKAAIEKEYGLFESTIKNKQVLARDASAATKNALNDELRDARRVHDDKISLLDKEYNAKLRTLNAESDAQIRAIQDQIDAIDKQTTEEDKAARFKEMGDAWAASKERERTAETEEEKQAARKDTIRLMEDINRFITLNQRESQKEELRQQIDAIKKQQANETDRLKEEFEAEKANLDRQLDVFTNFLNDKQIKLDEALERELQRLEEEQAAKEQMELYLYNLTKYRMEKEEKATAASLAVNLGMVHKFVDDVNAEIARIQDRTITVITQYGGNPLAPGIPHNIPGFAAGGVVPGPVGSPQLATVHGGETIVPVNESGMGVTVNFTQPVFFDREDQMNKFIDMISKGIDRKQRLRFGGAYSGS